MQGVMRDVRRGIFIKGGFVTATKPASQSRHLQTASLAVPAALPSARLSLLPCSLGVTGFRVSHDQSNNGF